MCAMIEKLRMFDKDIEWLLPIPGEHCCSNHTGIRPQFRLYYLAVGGRGCERVEFGGVLRGFQQKIPSSHNATTQNNSLEVQEIDEVGTSHTKISAGIRKDCASYFIATNCSVINFFRCQRRRNVVQHTFRCFSHQF